MFVSQVFLTTRIEFSAVWKQEELMKKEKSAEEKTKEMENVGESKQLHLGLPMEFQISQSSRKICWFLTQPGVLWGHGHFLTFCISSGGGQAKLIPLHFWGPCFSVATSLSTGTPKPRCPQPSCLPSLGQDSSPRCDNARFFQVENVLFIKEKNGGGSGKEVPE